MELTKLESELIVHEIILALRSIQYHNSREKKGEFCFKRYDKYDISDFDLHEAELTEIEFKAYMSILTKIKSLSTFGKKPKGT